MSRGRRPGYGRRAEDGGGGGGDSATSEQEDERVWMQGMCDAFGGLDGLNARERRYLRWAWVRRYDAYSPGA